VVIVSNLYASTTRKGGIEGFGYGVIPRPLHSADLNGARYD